MAVEATTRRWGNSIGIILPKEFVEKNHIGPDEGILLELVKKADLSEIFGSLKTKGKRMSGQAFKDMVRKGWS
ncbi:hypothetical protein COV19_06150 [Candidatus Woesearchaeota archaeon CG10_big_fil_rev_8_21_14_0_10_44_13]|nr:MAG: hypothetical protein COV19_06150 [Candidatus Woesearchaeota archaeon CG10_big_fil_rev_8_21_14_0_10_44_13]